MRIWHRANRTERLQCDVIARVFRHHPHLIEFLFDPDEPCLRLPPLELLRAARDLSHGEQTLIKVALDIWSGSGNAKVWQLIEILDERNFCAVLEALAYLKILAVN